MGGNINLVLSGVFFNGFLFFFNFFLLNTIYIGYKICLQSFARIHPAVVGLCKRWVEMSTLYFPVQFLMDFFKIFFLNTIYIGYKICLQSFTRIHPAIIQLCTSWVKMSTLRFPVHFYWISLIFFVTYDLFSFPQFVFFLFYSTITWLSFFQIQVFKSIDRYIDTYIYHKISMILVLDGVDEK